MKTVKGSSPRAIRANIKLAHGAGMSHKAAVKRSLGIARKARKGK